MGMTLKFSFNTILCMICFLFGVYGNIACLTEVVVEVKFILKMRSLLKCGLSLIFSTFHHSSFTFLFFIIQKTRVQRCIMSMSVSNSHCSNPSRITLWFRNDLRLDDNPIVYEAMQSIAAGKASEVLPVYTFDPRWFSQTEWKNGNLKTGHFRAQYLLGSVLDLKNRLRDIGSDLVICMGAPEEVLPPLALGGRVLAQAEVTSQEIQAENCVSRALKRQQEKKGCLELYWGSTLFHKDDLPFSQENGLADMPNVFTPFRQKCEDKSSVRKLLPGPTKNSLPLPKDLEISLLQFSPSSIEDLNEIVPKGHPKLRASAAIPDSRSALCFKGGETEALERLKYYVWESNLVSKYFEIRNGMIGGDYSTKLSPALAHGCISPRRIYHEIKKYESQREANKSTYWVIFELIWRDYFKFFAMKHGNSIFRLDGTASGKARNVTWSNDLSLLGLWKEGSTGWPLVDANMREMAATGWMSNRGRQNVASFLALDLGVDWRLGAGTMQTSSIICSYFFFFDIKFALLPHM